MIRYLLGGLTFFLFIFVLILGSFNFQSRKKESNDDEKFSFLNQFPYEMQNDETMKYSLFFRIMVVLFSGALIGWGCNEFFLLNLYGAKLFGDYLLGILFILLGINIFLLFQLSLKKYNLHLFSASMLFTLTVVIYIYMGVFILTDPRELYSKILAYICLVIGVVLFASLILTPLKKWMYLEKKEENGVVTYHRKRLSILPVMEWIFLLSDVIFVLILLLF